MIEYGGKILLLQMILGCGESKDNNTENSKPDLSNSK